MITRSNVGVVIAAVAWCQMISGPIPRASWAQDSVAKCIAANDAAIDLRGKGKWLEARKAFADCARAACGAELKETCEEAIEDIRDRLPTIVFATKDGQGADLPAVRLAIDGALRPEPLDGRAIGVDPGKHRFRFEASGLPAVEREFILREGEKGRQERIVIGAPTSAGEPAPALPSAQSSVTVSPPTPSASPRQPAERPPVSPWNTRKVLALVAGGVGLAAVGVGAGFGIAANSKWSAAQRDCGLGCGPDALAQRERHDALTAGTISTVFLGVGALAIVGAAVLWFTAPKADRAKSTPTDLRVQVWPALGTDGNTASSMLWLRGAF